MGHDDHRTDPLAACTAAVEDFLLGLRDTLAAMAHELGARLGEDGPTGTARVPTVGGILALVEPLVDPVLDDARVLGAGFVADPDALGGEPLLAWWQGDPRARVTQPATLGRDADYRSKEWFRAPLRAGGLHVTGPYLDYVCSDEFVLTLTLPVVDATGTTLGLAGADVLAETMEQVLTPVLAEAGAVLVNRHGQVVVAGDGRAFAGDRLADERFDVRRPCRDLPLTVLARGAAQPATARRDMA